MNQALTELRALRPDVLVVWPEKFVPSQLAIWEDYFLHSTLNYAIVARGFEGRERPVTRIPFFSEDDDEISLTDVSAIESIRVVLYPTVRMRFRKHINAFGDRQNVFIGHGDSDKASSSRSRNKIFDRIFVADPEARERYGKAIPDTRFALVGAPFIDGVVADTTTSAIDSVLYAPTWEGHDPDNNFTSIVSIAANVERCDVRSVRFLPHPGAGIHSAVVRAARDALSSRFALADRENKAAEFNLADALVTDFSGVLTEFLATRKPIVLVDPGTDNFRRALSRSGVRSYAAIWNPRTEPLSRALQRSIDTKLNAARAAAAESKFHGALTSEQAWVSFDAAVRHEIEVCNTTGLLPVAGRIRKKLYKKNPVTAVKAVFRFILRR